MTDAIGEKLVVADAGPLIHLDELSVLDVLSEYAQVCVPDAVWQEVMNRRPNALGNSAVPWKKVTVTKQFPRISALAELYSLHSGEQEALTLCLVAHIDTLLSDDTAARLAANNLRLTTHGTLGLLLRAVRTGTRTPEQVLTLLQAIPQRSTLHIRPSLLAEVIAQARTAWGFDGGSL